MAWLPVLVGFAVGWLVRGAASRRRRQSTFSPDAADAAQPKDAAPTQTPQPNGHVPSQQHSYGELGHAGPPTPPPARTARGAVPPSGPPGRQGSQAEAGEDAAISTARLASIGSGRLDHPRHEWYVGDADLEFFRQRAEQVTADARASLSGREGWGA
jgi:hypothetical protein